MSFLPNPFNRDVKFKQTKDVDEWIRQIENNAKRFSSLTKNEWSDHVMWWKKFWEKSWIMASDNSIQKDEREVVDGVEDLHFKINVCFIGPCL